MPPALLVADPRRETPRRPRRQQPSAAPPAANGERNENRASECQQTAGRRQLWSSERQQGQRARVRRARRRHEIRLRVRSLEQHGRGAARGRQAATDREPEFARQRSTNFRSSSSITRRGCSMPRAAAIAWPSPPIATSNWRPSSSAASRPTAAPTAWPRCELPIAMQPDVIFFLTDDDDPMPESELAEVNQLNRRSNAAICTIQFGERPAQKSATISWSSSRSSTGGQYGYVDTTKLPK